MAEVHISDIPEVIPDPPESAVPQEPVEPTPAVKKRGRPPGTATNHMIFTQPVFHEERNHRWKKNQQKIS